MASVKSTSSKIEAAQPYLEGVAKNLVDRIWGPSGPLWGTKLTEMEDVMIALQQVILEKMLQLALQRQVAEETVRPTEFQNCPNCGGVTADKEKGDKDREKRTVATRVGKAQWPEPHLHCPRCRRDFFPSVPKSGD